MLTDAVIIALAVGWARRGSLSNLADVSLRLWWLIILAFLVEAALPRAREWGEDFRLAGIYASYLLLLLPVVLNLDKRYFKLIGLGILLNFIVIAANGAMPADLVQLERYQGAEAAEAIERGASPVHEPLDKETRLTFLADVIPFIHIVPLSLSYKPWVLISIGDILMSVGLLLFLQNAMVGRPGRHRQSKRGATSSATSEEPDSEENV